MPQEFRKIISHAWQLEISTKWYEPSQSNVASGLRIVNDIGGLASTEWTSTFVILCFLKRWIAEVISCSCRRENGTRNDGVRYDGKMAMSFYYTFDWNVRVRDTLYLPYTDLIALCFVGKDLIVNRPKIITQGKSSKINPLTKVQMAYLNAHRS